MIVRWIDRVFAHVGTCLVANWPDFPRASHDYRSLDIEELDARVEQLAMRAAARRLKLLDAEAARPEIGHGHDHGA